MTNGLLIWIGVVTTLNMLVNTGHAGGTQRLLNLALGNRDKIHDRLQEPPQAM